MTPFPEPVEGRRASTSSANAKTLAQTMGLELPPERVDALVRQLSEFMAGFEAVRAVDKGDREPPTITWEREA